MGRHAFAAFARYLYRAFERLDAGGDVGEAHAGIQDGSRVEPFAVVGVVYRDGIVRIGQAERQQRGARVLHAVVDEFADDTVENDLHVGVETLRFQVGVEPYLHIPVRVDGDGLVHEVADCARQAE